MQAMMEGLLQYSRLNTLEKNFSRVDLGNVIKNILLSIDDSIQQSSATIIVNPLPTIHANMQHMELLFKALIDNAIKFQPAGNKPLISISAEKKDGYWQLSISDNGIGIKQQFQDKVFKLFCRLHPDNQYPGVGVGLTLVQKIVHQHGGKIWFESSFGSGSIFYFTLPLE